MSTDFIYLQNAHVTQHTSNGIKTEWKIEQNISNELLGSLPPQLTEDTVFAILNFARKYELIAFNEGIKVGKDKTVKVYDEMITTIGNKLAIATEENIRLAEALERHIIFQEN